MPEILADMKMSMFGRCAELCARHQWEVIVTIVTFTICMLTLNERQLPTPWFQTGCQIPKEYFGADAVIMTAVRCIALLYTYQQFRKLHSLGSKYILGLAGVFMVISTAVFTSSIINFMHSGLSDLKDALFFFLLLVDMSKVSRLAQYALSASHVSQVSTNISAGMAVLGPQITLDVLVEVLLISVGTLSGVYRLEMLCCYACMSALVSYLMFMTFYPACLSLVLEMSSDDSERQPWQVSSFSSLLLEDANKPNIVVQRVKVIMSVGLTFVHFISRWPSPSSDVVSAGLDQLPAEASCEAQVPSPYHVLLRWMSVSAEHLVILIIVVALVVKYVLFEQVDSTPAVPDKPEVWGSSGRTGRRRCPSVVISESADGGVKVTPVDDSDDEDGKVKSATDVVNAGSQTARRPVVKTLRRSRVAAALRRDAVDSDSTQEDSDATETSEEPRPLDECHRLLQEEGAESVTDAEVLLLLRHRRLRTYQLESRLEDLERAVSVRRQHLLEAAQMHQTSMDDLPYTGYEYDRVLNTCCENVVGYMPLPIGVVGPLHLNGDKIYVPLATTEGALVASTNRGCLAIRQCGVNSYIVGDGMTRAPVIECPSAKMASEILFWLELSDNFRIMKEHFDSTSRFARLKDIQVSMFGRQLFLRFVAQTGDAMGMNMVSKGTEKALERLKETFPEIVVTSVSSNVCTDKKPSAVNWIKGRGKSVICEAVIPAEVVRTVLKTNAAAMVNLCIKKNLIGSAVAGSIGGNNAHAANIVTAIYIATGQDPAQNVGSSSCMTLLEPWGVDGQDLYVTCTMPCVEVGTVGGGTVLSAQRACLKMLGCQGANYTDPGKNARRLASVVGATVLAGEVSLLAAQSAGHLVKSHMVLNRSSATTAAGSQSATSAQNTAAGSSQHSR